MGKAIEKETGGSIASTIKEIRKKFGDDSIMYLGDKPNVDVEAIPTGSIGLDWAIGIGGFPRGRIVEIAGPESSGKTTLALHTIAEAQKKDLICAFIDAEHAMDPQYAKRLGVKTESLLISQPGGGEEALQICDAMVRSGKFGVIVIDSVAALTPKAEIEGEIGQQTIGAQARLMSQAMRQLAAPVAKSKTLLIFINQIRMNIGGYGNPETTTGGKALKFYSSVRLDIRRIAQIKKGDEIIGGRTRVKVVKNKVASPFKQTEFDILYNKGISRGAEIIALGELHGVVKLTGHSYSWDEEKIGRGYGASAEYLEENEEIASKILKEILSKMNS